MVGCNYWASNAGVYMWRNFDARVIEQDFKLLSEHGVDTIRVFPLWPDFQPVTDALVGSSHAHHIRSGDQPLKTRAGLDPLMMERFGIMLDLAEKYGFKVIVALITGWMSGRLFVPPLLMNKNPLTDPLAIVWECKFIGEFVPAFKDRKCILAWEPGNECNCLTTVLRDRAITPEQAELWFSAITNTIRVQDPSRPVFTGLYVNNLGHPFDIKMMAQYADAQTTHPYPLFTPYCSKEPLTAMRAALHSAAQTALFMGASGQGCLVEEIGTLGATILSDDYSAKYLESSFFSSLQCGSLGYLWWCAFDQDHLDFAPYDGTAIEQTLGLSYNDGKPKPVLKKLSEMKGAEEAIGDLPAPRSFATVILTDHENSWRSSYAAFCLAAGAGGNVEFMYKSDPLKASDRYIIPSLSKDTALKFMSELIEKIEGGAKLLITYDGGHIAPFERLTGLKVKGREVAPSLKKFKLLGKDMEICAEKNLLIDPGFTEVLAKDGENIILTRKRMGLGEVYFLNAPLEAAYSEMHSPEESGLSLIYKFFFEGCDIPLSLDSDKCYVTYHDMPNGDIKVLITSFDSAKNIGISIGDGYDVCETKFCAIANNRLSLSNSYAYILLSRK